MEPQPESTPKSARNSQEMRPNGPVSSEHSEQPLAPLAPVSPHQWHPVAPTIEPLSELKKYAREVNEGYLNLGDSIVMATNYFGSLHITVEADCSRPEYPRFVALNKVPNLHGLDPYRIIFPGNPYLDERRHFFAAITIALPNRLQDPASATPAGVQAGLAAAGEKPSIPRDQAVMAWLEYDSARDCYTVRRPNTRGLGDYSDYRFKALEPHQKLLDTRWAWAGLERALQLVLPEGLIAEDRHQGALRDILNDTIDIRAVNPLTQLPRPYEMTAYLLDAIAEVNTIRGGFLWSKEISRPARPPVIEISEKAEQFALTHQTREAHQKMCELEQRGEQLLGIQARWSTLACVGGLVTRLEEETIKSTPPSRLAQDLKKMLGWQPKQRRGPECVRDFLIAVEDIKSHAEIGGRVSAAQCKEVLGDLDRGLRALAAAGQEDHD